MRYSILILIMIFMTACSQTVKVKQEDIGKTGMLDEVPKWFVEHPNKKKDKNFIYGVGVATSPDLQLAKDKAMMIAKADIADIVAGEMNKKGEFTLGSVVKIQLKDYQNHSEKIIFGIRPEHFLTDGSGRVMLERFFDLSASNITRPVAPTIALPLLCSNSCCSGLTTE